MTRAEARAATRHAVAQAAWSLFAEQGYDPTTVRQIAQRAGVSVGTVINAGGTAGLLLDLVESAIADRMSVASTATSDPAAAIWRRFAPYFDYFASMPELARAYGRLLFTDASRNHRALTTQADAFVDLIAGDITSGIDGVAPHDARHAADAVFACYLRALATWGSGAVDVSEAVTTFRAELAWQLARFDSRAATTDEPGRTS